ncbi:MAG: hypothetical protein KatS3mg109_2373 [Pirellulaceae bacterium]|nr:MAG: hypothetical protein KatS3mg109_2373 [Pirellulaceae bacterium]
MKSQVAFYAVAFVLWPVLAVLAVVPVGAIVYAQLNCQERRCVEVRYQAKDPDKGDIRNIYCVRTRFANGVHHGYAFSLVRAYDNCYGQDSKGGESTDRKAGTYWEVKCDPDCNFIPDDAACSGMVAEYLSDARDLDFATKCTGLGPEPDPQPDPNP